MPTKILNEPSNSALGIVNKDVVDAMIFDYKQNLLLSNTNRGGAPVKKYFSFDINEAQISAILEQLSDPSDPDSHGTKIRISLVLNPAGKMNCDGTSSIEDYLSIIISGVDDSDTAMLNVNDDILIEGYKDFSPSDRVKFSNQCCVVGNPPSPGG